MFLRSLLSCDLRFLFAIAIVVFSSGCKHKVSLNKVSSADSADDAGVTKTKEPTFKFGQGRRALVYQGSGVCDGCDEDLRKFLTNLGFNVQFVGPKDLLNSATFQGVTVYAQPGGDDTELVTKAVGDGQLWDTAAENIQAFVKGGGTYLGVCLGAYLAGSDLLGFLPVEVHYFTKGLRYNRNEDQVIRINWLPNKSVRQVFFQDGPALPKVGTVYGTYSDGTPAMLVQSVGKGKVVLSGIHFEATEDWYEKTNDKDTDGIDADLGAKILQDALSHL